MHDGPAGIRQATYASVFGAGLTAAATWDRDMIRLRGQYMAEEFREKGAHIALAPVCGPLGRTAYGGRNWEGFSPDPYLTGVAIEETVKAMQAAGVQATTKHFIGNEQETQRNPTVRNGKTIEAVSSNIDDETLHELYLWPFANAVRAGTASIMCSYQRMNNSYGCQNSKILNGLLKDELGFQGYVMSDWGATHAGVAAIEAGLDMTMPGGISFSNFNASFFGGNVTAAVRNGTLPEARLDDMVRRIMTPYYHLRQDEGFPKIDSSGAAINGIPTDSYKVAYEYNLESNVDVRSDHARHIRELGAAGTVLLKNVNHTLPLIAAKTIGVFGNDAGDLTRGQYSLSGKAWNIFGYESGTIDIGGGSGTGRHTYIVPPLDAIKARAAQNGALVEYILDNEFILAGGLSAVYPLPEVCIVFTKTWGTEDQDRLSFDLDWNGTAIVEAVAAKCSNTVVVTHSSGPNHLPFADHPNVTAILAAHYPGQESGNSIVDVLYGAVNPSGKLPYTIANDPEDYAPKITNSTELQEAIDPNAWQSYFIERWQIDYRIYDFVGLPVRYEFGFGLSYTTFELSNLTLHVFGNGGNEPRPFPRPIAAPGGNEELWVPLASAMVIVTNTGSVAGATVAQLYAGIEPLDSARGLRPERVLRGFEKTAVLEPGESQICYFLLMRRDLSVWDRYVQDWVLANKPVNITVGSSSRDLRLTGQLKV